MHHDERDGRKRLAPLRIEQLLQRHGVPKRERLQLIADHLGLAYQQVRRRMLGAVDWSLEDLQRIGERFGETLDQVVAQPEKPSVPAGVPALLVIGGLSLPCTASIGPRLVQGQRADLVAVHLSGDEMTILPMQDAQGAAAFQVLGISITPRLNQSPQRRVAVLDDDRQLAASIVSYMQTVGVDAMAFYNVGDLLEKIASIPFDGYVIDWLISGESALQLIANLRMSDPTCAIVVLTGQLVPGNVKESELLRLASTYKLSYFEKPTRTSSILSSLEIAFNRRSQS